MAGGARGRGQAFGAGQDHAPRYPWEGHVQGAREPIYGWPVAAQPRGRFGEEAPQAISQGTLTPPLVHEVCSGDLTRAAEADDVGDVLGAGADAPLLAAAQEDRRQDHAVPDVERTDTLGRVELVPGDGQEIDIGTSPTRVDTDDDRLEDGAELGLGLDPLDDDSDDDGLLDGDEIDAGADPLDPDTDDDTVPDGPDPDPLDPDADNDLIPDARELVDGHNAWLRDAPDFDRPSELEPGERGAQGVVLAAGAADPMLGTMVIGDLEPGQRFRVVARAGPSIAARDGLVAEPIRLEVVVEMGGSAPVRETFGIRVLPRPDDRTDLLGDRWLSTDTIAATSPDVRITVLDPSLAGGVRVDRAGVVEMDGDATRMPTLADDPDSDGDGIDDGDESWNAFWFEIEHHADPSETRVADAGASNGQQIVNGATGGLLFGIAGDWGFVSRLDYDIFVRGRIDTGFVRTSNNIFDVDTGARFSTSNVDFTDAME